MPLTTLGKERIAALLNGEAVADMSVANLYVGVGNGSDAFDAADTDLQGVSTHRVAATSVTRAGAVLTVISAFPDGDAEFEWAEAALFDAASAGLMFAREVSALGTKASGVWNLTLTASLA